MKAGWKEGKKVCGKERKQKLQKESRKERRNVGSKE